ncbi:pentatricopeptide repeat-containing protein At4g14170 [Dioscorea cayenensis subsp. rotundata]|uniref:Pentatricopeptide repeat-containing protein At4g14170 n=1 Tax=Dioscorea cayennensis subsp. rotundata TaxID=55577 RepID=A0AB40CBL8_DIOCR|nr:pentatricopeptide repeat-containing protein At4g14170 [Dioscorea cayenensis subsp. rotundata]
MPQQQLCMRASSIPRLNIAAIFTIFSNYSHVVPNPNSYNILISNLSKSNQPHQSLNLFRTMLSSGVSADAFTLPAVLRSCAALRLSSLGPTVHCLSVKSGLYSNLFVASALVIFYVRLGRLLSARYVFDEMPERDAVLWTAMLSGYAQSGEPESALGVLREMVSERIELDGVVMVSLLLSCGQLGWLRHGKSVHGFSVRRCFGLVLSLGNALIDLYVKCGDFSYAEKVFDGMSERDVISWTALILGHGLNGRANVAFKMFDEMRKERIEPNMVTFLGVLSACAHAGMVEKAWGYFSMMNEFGVACELKHYACLIDAMARAGQLEEAERLAEEMPVKPDRAVFGAILAGCRVHGNSKVAQRVSKKLLKMHPDKSGYYMSIANIYADLGRPNDAEKIRDFMLEMNVDKLPGLSSIV